MISVKINQYHIIGKEMERSRRNIFRYSGRILSKDSALEGGKGMKCTFIEVKHIWGNTLGNSNVTFGKKKSGFQGPKQLPPKFYMKFKNPGRTFLNSSLARTNK